MRMKTPKKGSCDPLAPLELPHSLHAFHRVSPTDELNKVTYPIFLPLYSCLFFGLIYRHPSSSFSFSQEGCHTFRGGFWNYFSLGEESNFTSVGWLMS